MNSVFGRNSRGLADVVVTEIGVRWRLTVSEPSRTLQSLLKGASIHYQELKKKPTALWATQNRFNTGTQGHGGHRIS